MGEAIRISDAEWTIMEVLWSDHPQGADEITARVAPLRDWSERTVKTLLGRLVRKGALSYEQEGRRYLYSPAVARDASLLSEGRHFLDRCFGGQTAPAVAHFVKQGGLSETELAELRRLLDEEVDGD